MHRQDSDRRRQVREVERSTMPRVPQARGAEVVPRGSTRWLLLHLIREVRDPDWSAAVAARRVLGLIGTDVDLLWNARARLVLVDAQVGRPGEIQARAITTIDSALQHVSARMRSADHDRGVGGGG